MIKGATKQFTYSIAQQIALQCCMLYLRSHNVGCFRASLYLIQQCTDTACRSMLNVQFHRTVYQNTSHNLMSKLNAVLERWNQF